MNGLYQDLVYNKSFTEKCRDMKEIAICLKIKLKKLLDIYNRIEISVYGTLHAERFIHSCPELESVEILMTATVYTLIKSIRTKNKYIIPCYVHPECCGRSI